VHFLNTVIIPAFSAGALYALIALGFAVLFRVTKVLNFAHGQLVTLAPLSLLAFHEKAGLPTGLSYLLSLIVVLAVALAEERVAIRPFLQSGRQLPWIVSTLGVSVILGEVLTIPFSGAAQSFSLGLSTAPFHFFGGLVTSWADVALVLTAFVLAGLLAVVYARTRLGLKLQAASEDLQGATAVGIEGRRMSQVAALAAGLVAAITGFALAPTQLVSPALGLNYTFYGFVAASLGGLGSLGGAVLGGFAVGLVSQVSAVYVGSLFVNLLLFGTLLAVYVVRPFGVFGRAPLRAV
jgi:branched-chain amino acid transport system permease protein